MIQRAFNMCAVFGVCLALCQCASGDVVYVDAASGSDGSSGLSWAEAKKTIQAGINAASPGDDVWVTAGTYNERITVNKALNLYGAFLFGGTDLSYRGNLYADTTINGGNAGTVVTVDIGATADTTRIDGFWIKGGKAPTLSPWGGGVYCTNASATIAYCNISGNQAATGAGIYSDTGLPLVVLSCSISNNTASYQGGGIFCGGYNTSLTVDACEILLNSASTEGGGIHCGSNATATITGSRVEQNTSPAGGGIAVDGATATISGCSILQNQSTGMGGAGVLVWQATLHLTDNLIQGNVATNRGGGAYYLDGGGSVQGNTFDTNSAIPGDGLALWDSSPSVTGCVFKGQRQGIHCYSSYASIASKPVIGGCTFSGNTNGLVCDGTNITYTSPKVSNCTFDGNTVGALNSLATVVLTSCTFVNNTARAVYNTLGIMTCTNCSMRGTGLGGGATAVRTGGPYLELTNCSITNWNAGLVIDNNIATYVYNSIIWGNNSQVLYGNYTPSITYSCIQGGWAFGANNISANPNFYSGSQQIPPDSPCADAGWNYIIQLSGVTTDVGGHPRFVDTPQPDTGSGPAPIVDMGAYEAQVAEEAVSAGGAKLQDDGTRITITENVVVSMMGFGFMYVQTSDRSSGIRVDRLPGQSVSPGLMLKITGVLSTNANGERVLTDAVWQEIGYGNPPEALGMSNAAVGAIGLSNQGLLVRVNGRVISVDSDWVVIDDGSRPGGLKVLRASLGGVPAIDSFVSINGAVSAAGGEPVIQGKNWQTLIP